jgi:DNA-binding NtrC family response regulator
LIEVPKRSSAVRLPKLLDAALSPVYVVDERRRIVYRNRACAELLGDQADAVIGQECRYSSSDELGATAALAAALCPPPEAFEGQRLSGGVTLGDGTNSLERTAEFVPLPMSADGPNAVLVIVGDAAGESTDERDTGASAADVQQVDGPQVEAADDLSPARLHSRLRHYRRQLAARFRVDRLYGDSVAMRQARRQIALAATSAASVLVVGPPGSPREHVARAIHHGDGAAAGPFVPLACPLLDADLLRATLRALAKAKPDQQRPATLHLDDAESLPEDAQLELARVLAGGQFSARVVSSVGRPLGGRVKRGTFRPELACLLSTVVIRLPPLANRIEDLPLLAQSFIERENATSSKQLSGFTAEALERLAAYHWPGDVAELAKLAADAHARAAGPAITSRELPERIGLALAAAARPRLPDETIVLEEFLGRIEHALIMRAMKLAKGNKTKAARLLGMTRPRLYRRLVQLGLEQPTPSERSSLTKSPDEPELSDEPEQLEQIEPLDPLDATGPP